jgi:hypothetical protein
MISDERYFPRLFLDETTSATPVHLPGFAEFSDAFANLTGWTLAYRETAASRIRREGIGCRNLPAEARIAIDDLSESAIAGSSRAAPREKCERLIEGANSILAELDRAREEIWRKNAELAAGIPVTDDGCASEKLAILLNSLLTSSVDVAAARQAALYLLDDGTQALNLRTQVGFTSPGSANPTRELSGAKADLEALLGHAVVMEDAASFANWDIPANCGSALCVPVSSANNLLGTLWIFDVKPRDFTGAEVNMVEIIAGRIAAELERFTLLQAVRNTNIRSSASEPIETVARPQLPNVPLPIDELKVSGIVHAEQPSAAGTVYDWAICQRGRLAFLVAHGDGAPAEASRAAIVLQTAFRAHSAHCQTALQLFDSVFETAMSVSSGDHPVRFTCGYIEPDTGRGELASTERHPGAVSVIGDEFQFRIDGNPDTLGEFGLAHAVKFFLDTDEELIVAISQPTSFGDERAFKSTNDDLDEFDLVGSSVVVDEESAAVALRIKRLGTTLPRCAGVDCRHRTDSFHPI